MSILSSLFKRVVRLNEGDDMPAWRIQVWDDGGQLWRSLGGAGGGTPLLRPGGLQHAVETVVLPGDPPDAVMLGGDYVYVRRMQPDFTLSPNGDLTMVEGA